MGLPIDPRHTLPADIAAVVDGYRVERSRALGDHAPLVERLVRVSAAAHR